MKKSLLLVIMVSLFFAAPVMAKEGFYLGLFIPNTTISGDAGSGVGSGSGYGFRAGMGFNRYFSIEGNYSRTDHDITGSSSADLQGLSADIKLNLPLTSLDSAQVMTLEPYLLLGYGHYELKTSPTRKGDGLQYGIGIELYLFRELSVEAGWTKTKVKFKDGVDADGDVKTVDFGFIYHFL